MPTNRFTPRTVASFFLVLTSLSGCSSSPSDPQPSPDGGKDAVADLNVSNDVEITNDVTPDTTRSDADATPPDAPTGDADAMPPDGDAASCMCTTTHGVGTASLPCVCEQTKCPDFAAASTTCPADIPGSGNRLLLLDHSACGLMAIELHWGLDVSTYVFDATTHQLVGEEYASHVDGFTCGGDRVGTLRGGTLPTCAASSTTTLCGDDAGIDAPIDHDGATTDVAPDTGAPDGDGPACTCMAPDAGLGPPRLGTTSLACFCGSFGCPTLDAAKANCPPNVGDTNYNTLVYRTYASCGLVEVERHDGFGRMIHVFDAITQHLVGAQYQTDIYICGTARVPGVGAGTFPDSSCVATTEQLCTTHDAGGD